MGYYRGLNSVFIHVPKTGGTAVAAWLAKHETPKLGAGPPPSGINGIGTTLHHLAKHLAAAEVRDVIGKKEFCQAFRFACVRNPFVRLVSTYEFMLRNKESHKPQVAYAHSANNFCDYASRMADDPAMRPFFQQALYIDDPSTGECLVDCICRTEHLDADLEHVADHLGITYSAPTRVNVSVGADKVYREYYDNYTRELVTGLVKQDLRRFDYDF